VTIGRLTTALTLSMAAACLAACTSDDTPPAGAAGMAPPATSTFTAPSGAAPGPEDVGEVPVRGGDRTVGAYGAEQVAAAATTVAQTARIALADCVRWTTGELDPRLSTLVTPELLARAQQELDEAPVYGLSGPPPSLLSHLPEDDGNGNALAADVRDGCDGSAPLRWNQGPLTVAASSGGEPGLVFSGAFMMNVRFGETVVSAGQDWTSTVSATPDGWRVPDVADRSHQAPARGSRCRDVGGPLAGPDASTAATSGGRPRDPVPDTGTY
jgi:hypothetical protein